MSLLSRRMMMTNTENGGSEMDKWETLIDYTHSGDSVGNKTFTVGDDGQPFNLKKVSVFVAMAPPTDPAMIHKMDFYVGLDGAWRTIKAKIGQTPKNDGQTLYGKVLFEPKDYGMYPTLVLGSCNDTAVRETLGEIKPMYGHIGVDSTTGLVKTVPDVCTAIIVGSHYQKVVTAGTRVIVKGVRV